MKSPKSLSYKLLLLLLLTCNIPLMAARPSAFNSDLPVLYAAVAGLLFLIVEFRKLVNMLKNVTHKIINSAKK
jgi:hypothetical protein